jgi:Lipocalin-like domain
MMLGAAQLAREALAPRGRQGGRLVREESMKISARVMAATSIATFALAMVSTGASAQVDKNLVGTWTVVSVTYEQGGKKIEPYGPNVKGTQIYDANGRIATIVMRPDLPKVASNNRMTATAEESQKIVHGSIAYFGTYTTNEADHSVTVQIEGATLPNWMGTSQKRTYTISGDQLTISNPTGSGAGAATVVLKRAAPGKAM